MSDEKKRASPQVRNIGLNTQEGIDELEELFERQSMFNWLLLGL